jgi:small subunit ribosomal protein S17
MTEEEKQEQEPAAEEEAEEAAAEEGPAEEPADEAPAEEEPAAEAEQAAEEEPAADAGADAEPAEELTPKQRRKLERSRAPGPPRPQRTPEARAAERAERRRAAAQQRRRHRLRRRGKRGEPRPGTPPAERRRAARKVRQGTVVSSSAEKTITVQIEITRRHPTYEKVVRRSNTVHAHDERNEANDGDIVRVVETRPLSRTKRWRLLEVLERAR